MAINLAKTEEELTKGMMDKISLSKDRINLETHIVSLSKTVVSLSKKEEIDMSSIYARVAVVMDYSGSMSMLYTNCVVQNTLNRLVPLGLAFDDNDELDVYLFQNDYRKMQPMNLNNYDTYVEKVIDKSGYSMGGTEYAPVIKAIFQGEEHTKRKGLFGRKTVVRENGIVDDTVPTFVMFITDGDNSDKTVTDKVIREISEQNGFIQFVGIGNSNFSYLEKLDNLEGRKKDNTGFMKVESLNNIMDEELYNILLEQFAKWLKGEQ